MSVSTLVIHSRYEVEVNISPVHEFLKQVQGESSGLLAFTLHHTPSCRSVQTAALQLAHASGIGEEQLPEAEERKSVRRLLQPALCVSHNALQHRKLIPLYERVRHLGFD